MSLKLVVFLVFAVYAGFVLLPLLGFILSELHGLAESLFFGKRNETRYQEQIQRQYHIAE